MTVICTIAGRIKVTGLSPTGEYYACAIDEDGKESSFTTTINSFNVIASVAIDANDGGEGFLQVIVPVVE